MKLRACLALSLTLLALHPVAHADERERLVETILATGPAPCIDQASALMNFQLTRMAPAQLLERNKLIKTGVKPGTAKYRKALHLVAQALHDDELNNGPLFDVSRRKIVEAAANNWTIDEQRYFTTFFSSAAGKLYLSEIADGAECSGLVKAYIAPPFPALEGERKASVDALLQWLAGGMQRYADKLSELPPEQKALFTEGADKAAYPFSRTIGRVAFSATTTARIEAVLLSLEKPLATIGGAR